MSAFQVLIDNRGDVHSKAEYMACWAEAGFTVDVALVAQKSWSVLVAT